MMHWVHVCHRILASWWERSPTFFQVSLSNLCFSYESSDGTAAFLPQLVREASTTAAAVSQHFWKGCASDAVSVAVDTSYFLGLELVSRLQIHTLFTSRQRPRNGNPIWDVQIIVNMDVSTNSWSFSWVSLQSGLHQVCIRAPDSWKLPHGRQSWEELVLCPKKQLPKLGEVLISPKFPSTRSYIAPTQSPLKES